MPATEQPLSVAEVYELPASTEESASWVNPGFRAVVNAIVAKQSKTGKSYWDCLLGDEINPDCQISVSFFGVPPKFKEEQIVEFIGSGMRRTDFRGSPQVSLPQKGVAIHIIGGAAPAAGKPAAAPARASTPPAAGSPATGRPAGTGAQPVVFGATVGMAIKEALPLVVMAHGGIGNGECLQRPEFWHDVHNLSSDIIRVARMLESGKLAPPIKDRLNPPAVTEGDFEAQEPEDAPAQPARRPAPPPDRSPPPARKLADMPQPDDSDVPF